MLARVARLTNSVAISVVHLFKNLLVLIFVQFVNNFPAYVVYVAVSDLVYTVFPLR